MKIITEKIIGKYIDVTQYRDLDAPLCQDSCPINLY